MSTREEYAGRLDCPLPSANNAAQNQPSAESASHHQSARNPEHIAAPDHIAEDNEVNLRIVYHELRRPGNRPVHFELSGLAPRSTIEDVALRASEHLSNQASSSSSSNGAPHMIRLFHCGAELQILQESLDAYGISSGAFVTVIPDTHRKTLRVSQLEPSSGSETGGNSVHISGQCFRTSVERPLLARFGRTVVPTMPVSGEVVRCTSPPHPPGPVSVEVSSDGGHTWTSDNVTYTYIGLRTVLDQPIRVPSVHCSAMSTVQELERAALRHSRGF